MTSGPRPFVFFGLLFLLSVPFWLFGALIGDALLPGLPVSALMVVAPAIAAGLLVWRAGGAAELTAFLRRAGDFRGMRPWVWLVAFGTMPAVMVLSGVILVAVGAPPPAPQIGLTQTVALFALFFVSATAEELGWTAYATRPLVKAHGLIVAGLIIGLVSVVWHVIPLLQVDRSWDWIAWWALGTLARRMIIVWLYVRGGERVFSASLFHAMNNVSWMLFPIMGSHYDPASTALILVVLAAFILARSGNTRAFG
ncbi:type II CAAX prenyl endopeptidase Rce1 family protein [Bauldia sp.]|uniref:CPBP family glutamic-type intramembrane protease n=1 Tax=Bauldia sp. TaxID=2575872 RepID=UPI003BAD2129